MIVTPPRLNGFRIKQQSFRQCVEQFKWNYVLEKEEDDDTDADDEDNEAAIDKDDDDDSYTDDDDDNVSSTTMSIKKRKYDIITSSGDGDTSRPDMAKSYPHLSQALGGGDDGFDPVDPSVRRSMHSLLRELNDLLSTEYRLDVSGISNHRISYVRVPRTKSNSSFRNSKEWLDTAIEISGSKHGGTFESAYRITNQIIRYYHDSFLAFDQLAAILKEGKRKDCLLSDDDIGLLCLHFREVYVLWDGAFSLARKIDPTDEDTKTYQRFVLAALQGSLTLQCSITPKVHAMLRHVKWQMKNLPGGLGDKMEDWVERLHQWGIRMRRRFRTVQDPLVRAHAREKASSRCNHPDVLAQVDETDAGNKQKLSEKKADLLLPLAHECRQQLEKKKIPQPTSDRPK
jgi:hypothetical protein